MAGAGKHRARKERKNGNDGNNKGSSKNTPSSPEARESTTSNSPPQAPAPSRFDGSGDVQRPPNVDPSGERNARGVVAVRAHRNMDLGMLSSYLQLGVSS